MMDQKPRPHPDKVALLKQPPGKENKTRAEAITFAAMLKDALDG